MKRTAVVKFDYPVMVKSSEVTEITIRKTKVKDELNMSKVSSNPIEQEVWLVSAISNIPKSDVENLDTDQYELILVAMGNLKNAHKKSAKKKSEED